MYQRVSKGISVIFGIVAALFVFYVTLTKVLNAQQANLDNIPPNITTCSPNLGKFMPTERIVLLPLNVAKSYGDLLPNDLKDSILYEYTFIKGYKYVPFNAMFVKNKLFMFYCDKPDFILNFIEGKEKGDYIVAIDKLATADKVQQLIDRLRVKSVVVGRVELASEGKVKVNIVNCSLPLCNNLTVYPDGRFPLYEKVVVEDVKYPAVVTNPQEAEVKVVLKNPGDIYLPGADLTLREVSPAKIPQFYNEAEWQSLKVVKEYKIGTWEPNTTKEFLFKTGKYLRTQKRGGTFMFYLGDKPLPQTRFSVAIDFKKGEYELGVIYSDQYRGINVRRDPGFNSEVVFKIQVGEYVIWHKQEGAWVLVETVDGRKGWVYARLVRKVLDD